MAEKIGNEMQTQGIKMKRPAVPTKVCRFPSHNCGLKSTYWNLLCMILQSWTKSVQKFALSYSQETHPANLAPHWFLPPPLPGQRCSVRSKNVPAALQHCFLGGKGEVCWVNSALQGCILKLDIQRGAYVLTLLSKIVDFPIIYCFLCLMVAPTTSDHQLHHYFLSLKSQELFSTLQLQYLFKIISVAIRNIQDHNKFCCSVKKLNVIQH